MLCLLTGRQVEHDANWGRVVDDFCPLVQVVHIIAAVIATVTKHQIQHQVLRESPKKTTRKSKRSTPWQLRCSEPAAGWSSTSLFDYSIIWVPWEVVWTDYEHTVSSGEIITLESSIFEFFCSFDRDKTLSVCSNFTIYIYISISLLCFDGFEVLITSMGLFFLPTLLVCSFSGCGSARLTGGLKQTAGIRGLPQSCLSCRW